MGKKDLLKAASKFAEFHDFEFKSVYDSALKIPTTATCLGKAITTYYQSNKWGDGMQRYMHNHEAGVKVYVPRGSVNVPQRIYSVDTLTLLGKSLGFDYIDEDGDELETKVPQGSELYCIPSGKALLIIQNKNKIIAMMWGGKLRVEDVGICG